MFFALATAAGLAACGADDEKKDSSSAGGATPAEGNPVVEMKTSMGSFQVELDQKNSPLTVANFLKYVEKKHFDNTIFHRVMSDFMIQGGGFEMGDPPTEKETLPPVKNEAKISGLKNAKYTIAMARTNVPDSATQQFFINVVDNGYRLDPGPRVGAGYAVFGKVISGTDVVDQIKMVPTAAKKLKSRHQGQLFDGVHENVPVKEVVIESVRLVAAKAAAAGDADKEEATK